MPFLYDFFLCFQVGRIIHSKGGRFWHGEGHLRQRILQHSRPQTGEAARQVDGHRKSANTKVHHQVWCGEFTQITFHIYTLSWKCSAVHKLSWLRSPSGHMASSCGSCSPEVPARIQMWTPTTLRTTCWRDVDFHSHSFALILCKNPSCFLPFLS